MLLAVYHLRFQRLIHIRIFKQSEHVLHTQHPGSRGIQILHRNAAVCKHFFHQSPIFFVKIIRKLHVNAGLDRLLQCLLRRCCTVMRRMLHDDRRHIRAYKAWHFIGSPQHVCQNFMIRYNRKTIDRIVRAHRIRCTRLYKCFLKDRHAIGKYIMPSHCSRCAV